jgi:cytochrome c-type biogenesis protein CcmH
LKGKHSLMVVEHDMAFIRQISDIVTVLCDGAVLAQGSLDQAGFDLSHQELTQRLLEDAPPPPSASAPTPASNKRPKLLLAGMAVMIPLMAFSAYFLVGTPMALDPQLSAQAHGDEQLTPERLASMADQLAERLQNEPNNAEGWVMLGRIQRALARYDEADLALQKSLALASNDDVMIERAEVLAQKNNGNFKGEPWAIINAVLKVDPTHGNALLLAGSAAFSEGRFKEALAYWERVKASLPPASPDAAALAEAIDQARERLGMPPLSPATNMANAPASAGVLTAKPASDGTERITGRVSIDPALAAQVSPQDIVFIYAHAAEGPRMPLAIIRTTVDKLPYDFVLDDSLAMNPQMKLSQVTSVMVRARISKTGHAMPQPGDFGASVGPVTPGSADKLKLNISQALQ